MAAPWDLNTDDQVEITRIGRELISDDRKVGLGVRLIRELTKAGRHAEAIELARSLYQRKPESRNLNILMTALVTEGKTEGIKYAIDLAYQHLAKEDFEYDVQLITTLLRALLELGRQDEFWKVYRESCSESDRLNNPYVALQALRMLIRSGRYQDAIEYYDSLSDLAKSDDLVQKNVARSLIEIGRIEEAEQILASTRNDRFRAQLYEQIVERKKRAGVHEPIQDILELPAIGDHRASQHGKPTIFIVHGHDKTCLTQLENLLHRIGAEPSNFDRLPIGGSQTVIEVLETNVPAADAIVTLLTPDDEGRKRGTDDQLQPRGRENVLIEAGFAMISRRTRSLLVALGGVHIPSDFEGIHRIQATEWSSEVAMRVAKRLREMGLAVDPMNAV